MEHTYSTTQFRWGHEETPGMKMLPPEEGDEQPQFEDVTLDTVVFLDTSNMGTGDTTILKLSFDKESLANFAVFCIQHLDTDGRTAVRGALDATGGIVLASADELPKPPKGRGGLSLVS